MPLVSVIASHDSFPLSSCTQVQSWAPWLTLSCSVKFSKMFWITRLPVSSRATCAQRPLSALLTWYITAGGWVFHRISNTFCQTWHAYRWVMVSGMFWKSSLTSSTLMLSSTLSSAYMNIMSTVSETINRACSWGYLLDYMTSEGFHSKTNDMSLHSTSNLVDLISSTQFKKPLDQEVSKSVGHECIWVPLDGTENRFALLWRSRF